MAKQFIIAQKGKEKLFFKELTKSGIGVIWTYVQERAMAFKSIEELNETLPIVTNNNDLEEGYEIFSFDVADA